MLLYRHHLAAVRSYLVIMPTRHTFLPVLPHCSDLARHTREESVHNHPSSLRKVDVTLPRASVRVNSSGRFPKRALCNFALNLLESALLFHAFRKPA